MIENKLLPKSNDKNNKNNKPDTTVAPETIPQAGESLVILTSILAVGIIGAICFIKYRKNRDIK